MRNSKITSILLALMGMLSLHGMGQATGSNACKDLLRETYEKMNDPNLSSGKGQACLMECDVRMAPRDSAEVGILNTSIRYLRDKKSFVYESDQMRYYWDGKQAATLIPGRRVAYLQEIDTEGFSEAKITQAFQLQDSFLVHTDILSCKDVCLPDGRRGRSIRLQMQGKWAYKFNVMFMTLVVDLEQERFYKIRVQHPPGSQAAYTAYHYKTLDFKYAGPAMEGSVRDMLFARGGELKSEFKNYQLINLNESHVE